MKGICLILFSLILFSCTKSRVPKDILPPDKMEKILWDQMRADAFLKDYLSRDTANDLKRENMILQNKIFLKHQTTAKDFFKSYDYYLQNDFLIKNLLDSILAKEIRANEKEKESQKIKRNEQIIPER